MIVKLVPSQVWTDRWVNIPGNTLLRIFSLLLRLFWMAVKAATRVGQPKPLLIIKWLKMTLRSITSCPAVLE